MDDRLVFFFYFAENHKLHCCVIRKTVYLFFEKRKASKERKASVTDINIPFSRLYSFPPLCCRRVRRDESFNNSVYCLKSYTAEFSLYIVRQKYDSAQCREHACRLCAAHRSISVSQLENRRNFAQPLYIYIYNPIISKILD